MQEEGASHETPPETTSQYPVRQIPLPPRQTSSDHVHQRVAREPICIASAARGSGPTPDPKKTPFAQENQWRNRPKAVSGTPYPKNFPA
jgi:hypothetical protein